MIEIIAMFIQYPNVMRETFQVIVVVVVLVVFVVVIVLFLFLYALVCKDVFSRVLKCPSCFITV